MLFGILPRSSYKSRVVFRTKSDENSEPCLLQIWSTWNSGQKLPRWRGHGLWGSQNFQKFRNNNLDQFIATLMEPLGRICRKHKQSISENGWQAHLLHTQRGLASTYVKKEDGIFVKPIKKGSQHQGLTFQVSASWQYKTVMVEPLAFNLGPIQVAFCEMWMTFKKWMCKQTALIA